MIGKLFGLFMLYGGPDKIYKQGMWTIHRTSVFRMELYPYKPWVVR
jgi:hypothetical protein